MRHLFFVVVVFGMLASCGQTKTSKDGFYGESFDVENAISVEEMVKKLSIEQPIEGLKVTGKVEEVCQAKGCWLSLGTENDGNVRVTFKDYGFLVPKNISGKTVVIQGTGQIEVTSVSDLKHFAEDEGQSEEEVAAITEPLEEFTFVATGVKIN